MTVNTAGIQRPISTEVVSSNGLAKLAAKDVSLQPSHTSGNKCAYVNHWRTEDHTGCTIWIKGTARSVGVSPSPASSLPLVLSPSSIPSSTLFFPSTLLSPDYGTDSIIGTPSIMRSAVNGDDLTWFDTLEAMCM